MEAAEIVCRQTNYTLEEAQEKLRIHGDVLLVIREYMASPIPAPEPPKSTVQLIFSEIGKFMEDKYRTAGR